MQLLEAKIEKFNQMLLVWDEPIEFAGIHFLGYTIVKIDLPASGDKRFRLVEINGEFALNEPVMVFWQQQEVIATAGAVVRTEQFDERYSYGGKLGVQYGNERTTFRLWAPTAMAVHLNLYADEDDQSAIVQSYAMNPAEHGVWTLTMQGDSRGLVYDYRLKFPNGMIHYSYDPYATACTADGRRSVVLSPEERLPTYFEQKEVQAMDCDVIFTANISQLTGGKHSGLNERLQHTYLGVVEPGTVNENGDETGLNYLQTIQAHYLQLGELYDAGQSCGKLRAPLNAFIPDGRFVTDSRPATRVLEMKKMIQGLHQSDIRIIMESNLAHVTQPAQHAFHLTVPGYYFRYDDQGLISDSDGFGNDLATERTMVRKYLIQVASFWLTEYDIDGLYLRNMGNIDRDTIRMMRAAMLELKADSLLYGDSQSKPTLLESAQKTLAKQGAALPSVGFLNEALRRDLVGNVEQHGFASSGRGREETMALHLLGAGQLNSEVASFVSPQQVIQYVVSNDDQSLYQQLQQQHPAEEDDVIETRVLFALTTLLVAQGWVMLPLTELLASRTTTISWDEVTTKRTFWEYLQHLIQLRRQYKVFHLSSYDAIHRRAQLLKYKDNVVIYSLKGETHTYAVMLNANRSEQEISLPTGAYEVLVVDYEVAEFPHKIEIRDALTLPALSVIILRRHDA